MKEVALWCMSALYFLECVDPCAIPLKSTSRTRKSCDMYGISYFSDNFLIVKPTRCTNFSNLYLE